MFATKSIGLANLLLLFLFIEILSMVRQYSLGQHELKLKTPLVITVVAVARYLIINMEHLTSKWILSYFCFNSHLNDLPPDIPSD